MNEMLEHEKEYEYAGNKFAVHVRYIGYQPSGRLAQEKHTWVYALMVNGRIIEQGPWYDLQGRNPSNEEVCDGVAAFWGDSDIVRESQFVEGSKVFELDMIVEKCAKKMFDYFMSEEPFDFDIIEKHIDKYGWEVALIPNFETMRGYQKGSRKQTIVRFMKFAQHDGFYMTTYELERSIYTKF